MESAANVVAASSFSLQAVLGRAWETGRARPGLFFALAFVSQVPAIVANYLWVENGFGGIFWPRIFIEMGGIFCKLFFQGGLAWAASRVLRDREASFGEALGCIAARSLHLALMALLMILVVSVCLFSFILPGFIMISLWFVAIEVCVIERLGVVDSLNRSEALTHGCRMKIFGLWAMVCVAVWVANYLGAHLVLLLGAPSLLVFLAGALAASVPTAFGGVMAVVVYFELRAVGEGRSFDRLLTFFD